MNAADQVIPRSHPGKFLDPAFLAGEEVAFQPEANGERGGFLARLRNHVEVARQVVEAHPPVVELSRPRHRAVVGEADLIQPTSAGGGDVFERFADRVAAQRGVDVIVREHDTPEASRKVRKAAKGEKIRVKRGFSFLRCFP